MNSFQIHGKDIDPRPHSRPCTKCARDVEDGAHCICVPSKPFFIKSKGYEEPRPFVVTAAN